MNRLETLSIIATMAAGLWAADQGVLGGYLIGIVLILVFCIIGCGLALLIVWLEERQEQRSQPKTCSHCGGPLDSYGLCPDL
jgi:ABC-type Mn2+/Zn2+ transport system permease subunit